MSDERSGIPPGYVEYIRPITERSLEVRKAYASGELKKRTKQRRVLSEAESKEFKKQFDDIFSNQNEKES